MFYLSIDGKITPGLEKFVHEFIYDRENELEMLSKNLQKQEFEEIRKVAHRWKGFCAPYGFKTLEEYCVKLEKLCEREDYREIELMFLNIKDYIKKRKEQYG